MVLFIVRNDENSPHLWWENFGGTDIFSIIYQRRNGNFRFPSISDRNLSITLKFPSKNYGEILVFFAVVARSYYSRADAVSILTKSYISRVAQTFVFLFILGMFQTCLFKASGLLSADQLSVILF